MSSIIENQTANRISCKTIFLRRKICGVKTTKVTAKHGQDLITKNIGNTDCYVTNI